MPKEDSFDATKCDVAILAGGAGTRLKSRTGTLPKPMAKIMGEPVLAHLLRLCQKNGFTRVALLVHYEYEAIQEYFGDGGRFGVQLRYLIEREARGTAGALRDALPALADRFLVLYGDTFAEVDLRRIWQHHVASGSDATLLLHPNDHPHDSDLVEIDDDGRVLAIHPYPHPENTLNANLVNAALYVMESRGLGDYTPEVSKGDIAKDTFPAMLDAGCHLHAVVSPEYIKDMGTPDRLDKVARDVLYGLPERLSSRHARAAVFLDRDGTLNEEVGHLSNPDQLRLLPGAGQAVRDLNRAGRLVVCVTNQPVLARGDLTTAGLKRIHAKLDHLLGQEHAYLDRLYTCPHHPDRGFTGEVLALKQACDCRKPGTGLFDLAVRELQIDRTVSWMVGDTSTDMHAGRRAGARTILVRTGHAGRDRKCTNSVPDYVVPDLPAAADWILRGHAAMIRRLLPVAADVVQQPGRLVLIGGPARAGKSAAARVLSELLMPAGRRVHILCTDGWLRPPECRPEGEGVCARHNMDAFVKILAPILVSQGRHALEVPLYDRDTRTTSEAQQLSIGPEDLLIVEGVTSLLTPDLRLLAPVRLYIDCDDALRVARLRADYSQRRPPPDDIDALLHSREIDELPHVRASAEHATHIISNF